MPRWMLISVLAWVVPLVSVKNISCAITAFATICELSVLYVTIWLLYYNFYVATSFFIQPSETLVLWRLRLF